MQKDDIDSLEMIRDYLKQHGLKSTLEIFEKEAAEKKKVK
jgi:hypothetical protein